MTFFEQQVRECASHLIQQCRLCGATADLLIGVFIPDEPAEFIGPTINKDQFNGLVYLICEPCKIDPDSADEIESSLVKH